MILAELSTEGIVIMSAALFLVISLVAFIFVMLVKNKK